jgi:UTP--glucose-1-phosphate uridylyltransferase
MPPRAATGPATGAVATRASARAVYAVVPAAGLSTRFLPATKTVPKPMLPLVDKPVLQYVVEEAAAAGITDVLLITGRGKTSMVDHFDRHPELEARLEENGDTARLEAIRRPAELAKIFTCRQREILGLGHAVSYAESHVGGRPFAVLLADEFTEASEPLLPRMLDLQAVTGGIVLGLLEVPDDQVSRYGIASVAPADRALGEALGGFPGDPDTTVTVTGLVEKPPVGGSPSNLAVIGRYVLPNGIFDAIRRTTPGSGGEIQLTDAMQLMLDEGTPVHGIVYRGHRYDTGVPMGYLQAVVRLACQHEQYGDEFRQWLAGFVRNQRG